MKMFLHLRTAQRRTVHSWNWNVKVDISPSVYNQSGSAYSLCWHKYRSFKNGGTGFNYIPSIVRVAVSSLWPHVQTVDYLRFNQDVSTSSKLQPSHNSIYATIVHVQFLH